MRYESTPFQCILFFSRMTALTLLWALLCVPILTAGAATASLYYSVWKVRIGEDHDLFRQFWSQFRHDLRPGVFMNAIMIVLGLVCLYFPLSFLEAIEVPLISRILLGIYTVVFLTVSSCLWPLLGRFQNSASGYFLSALQIAIRHFPRILLVTLVDLLPFLLCWFFSDWWLLILTAYLLFGRAFTALINEAVLSRIFARYALERGENDAQNRLL